jgi:hypothetical protein
LFIRKKKKSKLNLFIIKQRRRLLRMNHNHKTYEDDLKYRKSVNDRYYKKQDYIDIKYDNPVNNNRFYGNYDYPNSHVHNSGEYLKFLKYKNTPPPNDIRPKKLKYENFYTYNFHENNYNSYYNNGAHLNILSPTPYKQDKNITNNVSNHAKVYNNDHNYQNFAVPYNNNSHINKEKLNINQPINNNVNYNQNYISKYPVQISNRKRPYGLSHGESYNKQNNVIGGSIRDQNFSYYGQKHLENQPTMVNNRGIYNGNNNISNVPTIRNNRQNSCKIINAEDFLKANGNNRYDISNK